MVQPNNTGYPSDDQEVHDSAAKRLLERGSVYARELGVPLLVPTFPRPEPAKVRMYTHALGRNTILAEIDELKRIDLQLISMIDDALERLSFEGIKLEEKFLMMGFSASGMFVSRFTILHPERVEAAAIGSPGGWPIAPTGERNGLKLRYPVGVWDIEELVGEEFDIQSFQSIPLYFYMGDKDTNDAVIKPSRMTLELNYTDEDRELIFQQFGDTPLERWPIAEEIYETAGCSSQFVLYPGVEHSINSEMVEDVITFFSSRLREY